MRLHGLPAFVCLVFPMAAAAQPAPGASKLLTVAPRAFLESCRADIGMARASAAQLRTRPHRPALAALDQYDTAISLLYDAASRASLARSVHPDGALRAAAAECERDVEEASTELSLDRGIYDRLARLDVSRADAATKYYVTRTLRDFRRAGIDRDEPTRSRIRALREELVARGQQFQANVAGDVRTVEMDPGEFEGLPEDFRRAHPVLANGKAAVTTNNTDYQPFMLYAKSSKAREQLWRTYRQRGHPANVAVLGRMLEARQELAALLGFPTWADYVTGDKMIGTRQAADDFIQRVSSAAGRRLAADYAALLAQKRRQTPSATSVAEWDSEYLQEQVKVGLYGFESQSVRPYFEYHRVKQGVLDLTSRMFGITYRPVSDAQVWHPDVETFDVFAGRRLLGRIHLDMFPREHKYKHYAQFALANGKKGRVLPEGALVCNFPKPGAQPALMQHSDVERFFHEFGHLLHHVLGGRTRWAGISGLATEWDFVEAPSQMLEEWARAPEALGTFARHYVTGQPIPEDLVKRMRAADEFGKGIFVRQQMSYAAVSLALHSRESKGLDVARVVAEMQDRYAPFRFVEGTHFEASFTHLESYSAVYYTYMWSLVIAKDMFTVFKTQGLLNPSAARSYRRTVLEPGGSKPAAQLVEEFLGRPFNFQTFEEWLEPEVRR